MPTFDNVLNVDQSLSLRGLRKLSKAQLLVALSNNEQIAVLREQLTKDSSNLSKLLAEQNQALFSIQKKQVENEQRLLQQEISRLEHIEVQKFHRQRAVRLKEILHDFKSAKDPYVRNVFMSDFILPSRELIDESINELDEIGDKEYCLNLKHEIREVLENDTYSGQSLSDLNTLLDKKQKVVDIQEKEQVAEEAQKTIRESSMKLADRLNEDDKTGDQKITDFKRRLKRMKTLSIYSAILLAALLFAMIKGGAQDFYIVLAIVAVIIIFKYYSLRSKEGELRSEIEGERSRTKNKTIEMTEENSANEILLKQLRADKLEALSLYRKSYSDVIEKHPEFLKFQYLLDLYKI